MGEGQSCCGTVDVCDLIHLDYGLRAGTGKDGHLHVHLMNLPKVHSFPGIEWKQYRSFLSRYNIDIIGYEELSLEKGMAYSLWRFFSPSAKGIENKIEYVISGFLNGIQKCGKAEEIALAENIFFSVRAMEYRLRDISISYGEQLSHTVAEGCEAGKLFSDSDTINLFLNIHSFLVEAATLRDHLAAFLALKVFDRPDLRKMTSLLKFLKGTLRSEPIAEEVLEICNESTSDGWLARLSKLRNRIAHVSPISSYSQFDGLAVGRHLIGKYEVPTISFGIPFDPILAPNGKHVDVLKYCVLFARNMLLLTRHVVEVSGVKPELMQFSDEGLV
jgi:hypothetical protein